MKCSSCGFSNRETVKYCSQCGEKTLGRAFVLKCGKCASEVYDHDVFCGSCRAELATSGIIKIPTGIQVPAESSATSKKSTRAQAERKNVTIIFGDVSGFTAMSEKMDPEEVTALMNDCLTRLANVVTKYGGHIDKFIGDCIMALFGAPVAHENDPELALRASLDMMQAMREFNQAIDIKLEKELTLHVGVNTGIVIAGGVGSPQKKEYTVMGDTVNLASRLESSAGNGQIYTSRNTYNLTKDLFEFKELEPIQVKGKQEPVAIYEVLGTKSRERKMDEHSYDTRLIGRAEQLRVLEGCIGKLSKGGPQGVFLMSDAGLGKTRLKNEVRKKMESKGLMLIEGHCNSFSQSTSYFLFSEIFKQLFDINSDDSPDEIGAKIKTSISKTLNLKGKTENSAAEAMVFVGSIFGLDLGAEFDIQLEHMEPEEMKHNVFRAIRWYFDQLASTRPIVFILDDFHYADTLSLQLLQTMIKSIVDRPVMYLVLLRQSPEYSAAKLPFFSKKYMEKSFTEINFEPFTLPEIEEFAKELMQVDTVQDTILNMIQTRTEGNPFYIEEIVNDMLEDGHIEVVDGEAKMDETKQIAIPETIQGMIAARIDRLPANLKELLQIASVHGPVFKKDLLEGCFGDGHKHDAAEDIEALIYKDMIFERKALPELEYSFKNTLIQETAYSTLLHKRQREIHKIVAEQIEKIYSNRLDEYYELLAMHYLKSRENVKAYHFLVLSGEKAQKVFANKEAITHYQNAISVKDDADTSEFPIGVVYKKLSEVHELTGDLDSAIEARQKAYETLDDMARAGCKRNIGRIYEKQGNKEKALVVYKEVAELLKDQPDSLEMGRLLMNESWVLNRMREYDQAIKLCNKAIKIFEKQKSKADIAQAHNNLAVIHEGKGELDVALENNLKSMKIFSELNHKRKLGNAYLSLAYVYDKKKNAKAAIEYLDKALQVMEKIGNRYGAGTVLIAKGRFCLEMGDFTAAEETLTRALDIHTELDLPKKIVANEMTLSKLYIESKDYKQALQYVRLAREISDKQGYKAELAKVANLEGQVLLKQGKDPSRSFEEAIKLFKAVGRDREAGFVTKDLDKFKQARKGKGKKKKV